MYFYFWEVLWQMPYVNRVFCFPIQLGVRTIWFPNDFSLDTKYRDIWKPNNRWIFKFNQQNVFHLPKSPSGSSSSLFENESDSSSTEAEIYRHTTPPRIPLQRSVNSKSNINTASFKKKSSVYKYLQSWFWYEG